MRWFCLTRDRSTRRRLLLLGAALLAAPTMLSAQQLDAGDTLHIRLLDRVRSHHHARPAVRALVIAPVASTNGLTIIPPGSILSGHVTGSGKEHFGGKRHWLELRLDSVAVPIDNATNDTVRAPVSLRIVAVDDARESVDSAGRIVGPRIPSIVRGKRDWALVALGIFHPVSAIVLAATLEGEVAERHRAISLEAGTELSAVMTGSTTLPRRTEWTPPPQIPSNASATIPSSANAAIPSSASVAIPSSSSVTIASNINPDSIAASTPLRASLRKGNMPSDVIGIAVIGSARQMREACVAAGYTRAVPMNLGSDFKTLVRAAKGEGYAAQPVSELVLGGRAPNDVYEKVADTFLRRHHFRVWRWPGNSKNDDATSLWLIAATHDTGLMFSKQRESFTHRVDPRIDLERDKIVSDLVAANRVAALSYAQRTVPPGSGTINGRRAALVTDWRMAVLVLK